jgi:hypothetical protein
VKQLVQVPSVAPAQLDPVKTRAWYAPMVALGGIVTVPVRVVEETVVPVKEIRVFPSKISTQWVGLDAHEVPIPVTVTPKASPG